MSDDDAIAELRAQLAQQHEMILALSTAVNYLGAKLIEGGLLSSSGALRDFEKYANHYRNVLFKETSAEWVTKLGSSWERLDGKGG